MVAHVVLYEQRLNELESTVSAWTDHINATLSVLSRTVAQHNGVIPRVDAVAEMAVRLGDRLSAVEAWAERLNNAEALSERAYSMATELEKAAMSGTPYRIEAVR